MMTKTKRSRPVLNWAAEIIPSQTMINKNRIFNNNDNHDSIEKNWTKTRLTKTRNYNTDQKVISQNTDKLKKGSATERGNNTYATFSCLYFRAAAPTGG